jgi:hypothetical protein
MNETARNKEIANASSEAGESIGRETMVYLAVEQWLSPKWHVKRFTSKSEAV